MDRTKLLDDLLHVQDGVAGSRRALGRALGGLAAAGLAARLGLADGDAKKKKRKKRCPDGQQRCGRRCADTRTDPGHCGACGRACGDGETCSEGFCVTVSFDPGAEPELGFPRGIAAESDGDLLVADTGGHRLVRFRPPAATFESIGERGDEDGAFEDVGGLDVSGPSLFVADTGNHRIQRFDGGSLAHQLSWGRRGDGRGEFSNPTSVAVLRTASGIVEVYVADTGNHRVQVFDQNGQFRGALGGQGSGDGQFVLAVDVAVRELESGARRIYVTDLNNNRVQVFDQDLKFVFAFGGRGSGPGQFLSPRGIALDRFGRVYVADSANDRVQIFSAGGQFLQAFGSEGSAPGQLREPQGIAVAADGTIHVSDSGNRRVQSFKPAPSLATEATGAERGERAGANRRD
jgi:DNA-binding beta-propeller fold protein YncE